MICYACFVADVLSHLLVVLFIAHDVLLKREEKCGFIYTDDSNLYTRDVQQLTAQGPHSNDRNICELHGTFDEVKSEYYCWTYPLLIPYITIHRTTFIYLWFMGIYNYLLILISIFLGKRF